MKMFRICLIEQSSRSQIYEGMSFPADEDDPEAVLRGFRDELQRLLSENEDNQLECLAEELFVRETEDWK